MNTDFKSEFEKLTGFPPFKWQERLFHDHFLEGNIPSALDLPTGLGKTSVMITWYLAHRAGADVPRRLVYVVDRRAVVDQATTVAEGLREKSKDLKLCVSTLRGQYIDNKEWLADPAAPAIIVGTVDMIGSRLLFSGYGVSRKMRPYHAGLLGADVLVVLDEAHLVPPFEKLLRAIEDETDKLGPESLDNHKIIPPFKLLSLSATGRDITETERSEVFQLSSEDRQDEVVKKRLLAHKRLTIQRLDNPNDLADTLAEKAWELGNTQGPARVLVYCNRRKDAVGVKERIQKKCAREEHNPELLVGGRRVFERERLSDWLKQHGFIDNNEGAPEHPTFLIATSAGEVGVDLDADHMVCDLVEWERMVQRFGRVNRRGNGDAFVTVFAAPKTTKPSKGDKAKEWQEDWQQKFSCLSKPLSKLLLHPNKQAGSDAGQYDSSPGAILDLKERAGREQELQQAIDAATTPVPLRPALTRALVDAWSMTSLDKHTGRPDDIQPWLRGWEEDQQPQTTVIWRKHLPIRTTGTTAPKEIEAFFEAAPPHASEKLETETDKIVDWLMKRTEKAISSQPQVGADNQDLALGMEEVIGYILSPSMDLRGTIDRYHLRKAKDDLKKDLAGCTLVLDHRVSGISQEGMLEEKASDLPQVLDDEDQWLPLHDNKPVIRFRVRLVAVEENINSDNNWRERLRFDVERTQEGDVTRQLLVEKWRHDSETEDDRSVGRLQELAEHHTWTEEKAFTLAKDIGLPNDYVNMLTTAARLHDEGKRHPLWQQAAKVPRDEKFYAKTDKRMNTKLLDRYRHEFGSLSFAEKDENFKALPPDLQELVLHLIAAHHGWARPIISIRGCAEPSSVSEKRARDVALRFARLQKRWGAWGLAWWEALLRAADQQASRDNDEHGKLTHIKTKTEDRV